MANRRQKTAGVAKKRLHSVAEQDNPSSPFIAFYAQEFKKQHREMVDLVLAAEQMRNDGDEKVLSYSMKRERDSAVGACYQEWISTCNSDKLLALINAVESSFWIESLDYYRFSRNFCECLLNNPSQKSSWFARHVLFRCPSAFLQAILGGLWIHVSSANDALLISQLQDTFELQPPKYSGVYVRDGVQFVEMATTQYQKWWQEKQQKQQEDKQEKQQQEEQTPITALVSELWRDAHKIFDFISELVSVKRMSSSSSSPSSSSSSSSSDKIVDSISSLVRDLLWNNKKLCWSSFNYLSSEKLTQLFAWSATTIDDLDVFCVHYDLHRDLWKTMFEHCLQQQQQQPSEKETVMLRFLNSQTYYRHEWHYTAIGWFFDRLGVVSFETVLDLYLPNTTDFEELWRFVLGVCRTGRSDVAQCIISVIKNRLPMAEVAQGLLAGNFLHWSFTPSSILPLVYSVMSDHHSSTVVLPPVLLQQLLMQVRQNIKSCKKEQVEVTGFWIAVLKFEEDETSSSSSAQEKKELEAWKSFVVSETNLPAVEQVVYQLSNLLVQEQSLKRFFGLPDTEEENEEQTDCQSLTRNIPLPLLVLESIVKRPLVCL